jgi:LAS superfamily LD-carboxypeptidase LdcB
MNPRLAGPARATTLAAALLLAAFALLGLAGTSTPARGMGPLPACRYDDIMTSPRGYGQWPVTLVDTILRVSRDYVPPDLVSVSQADIPGSGLVRAVVIDDLREMTAAAKAAGAAIAIQSAYRSYATQEDVFAGWVAFHGRKRALQLSARPGHSEHQLGIGIDFRSAGGGDPFGGGWELTAAGKWMKAHAWEYGFVMSYPRGKIDVTCYDFEPWHFRYVGRELAANIHGSGLTQREYLWANFTTTVVPARTPRPKPDRTARPTETPPSTVKPSRKPSAPPPAPPSPGSSLPSPTAVPLSPPPPSQAGATVSPASDAPVPVPSLPPSGGVAAIDPAAAGLALLAGALVLALAWIGRMVLRRQGGPG